MIQFFKDAKDVIADIRAVVAEINALVADLRSGIEIPVTVNGESVTLPPATPVDPPV